MWQPGWEGSLGEMVTCVCLAALLCSAPETTAALLISHAPVQSKNLKNNSSGHSVFQLCNHIGKTLPWATWIFPKSCGCLQFYKDHGRRKKPQQAEFITLPFSTSKKERRGTEPDAISCILPYSFVFSFERQAHSGAGMAGLTAAGAREGRGLVWEAGVNLASLRRLDRRARAAVSAVCPCTILTLEGLSCHHLEPRDQFGKPLGSSCHQHSKIHHVLILRFSVSKKGCDSPAQTLGR